MIAIVDYGMGNLLSVRNALDILGYKAEICGSPSQLRAADKIILPGVGAFCDCLKNLRVKGFAAALTGEVLVHRKPILGICLGMQAMAERSYEYGDYKGLGWFDADVVRIEPADSTFRVPHVGWNQVSFQKGHRLFHGLPEMPDLYFAHSFHMKCRNADDIIATVDYGETVTAAVAKDNIFGTQFHPEKSQDFGLQILKNFAGF